MRRFTLLLAALLPFGVLAPGCSPSTSSTGQLITCQTDPNSGVILRCDPGDGGGSGTCQDIDEDGDGDPHDDGDDQTETSSSDDDDNDGIPDEDDCDEHEGEDGDDDGGDSSVADLPYDVKPQLGSTATPIADAFAEQGAQPAAIVSVSLDGGTWRSAELSAGTPFQITQDDCTHAGNRDVGRDRVFVTWQNADGSTMTDHLDIRYCETN